MRLRWLAGLLALAFLIPAHALAQAETGIRIASPPSGATLRGLVDILGTTAIDGFFSAELSFSYASSPTPTWFLIANVDQPINDGLLAQWDTNLVTDGDYDLRLRVTLQDGSILDSVVTGLRIRNLTPTETATVPPTVTPEFYETAAPTSPPTITPAPTATHLPTPTPLPPNPAAVTQAEIISSLTRGLFIAFLAFLIIGALLHLRR
ncbi:MAG: hypothetical protein HFACDABA_00189 [Anaerolineales bacterium]|nr:hypothetical protein [Anaerolineales bacterium]